MIYAKIITCTLCVLTLIVQIYIVVYSKLSHNSMYGTGAGLLALYFALPAIIYIALIAFNRNRLVDLVFLASLVGEAALFLLF
jgi:hypothetical protein